MMLEIEVCFPGGRFHGEEWPPEPARLFQALVAAAHLGARRLDHAAERDAALHWLENLPPPMIAACPAVRGCGHLDNYVPNNDDSPGPNAHVRAAKTLAVHAFPAGGVVTYRWTDDGTADDGAAHANMIAAMASLVTHLGQTTDGVFARGRLLPQGPSAVRKEATEGARLFVPREMPGGRWRSLSAGFYDLLRRRYPRSVSGEPPDFTNSRQVEYASADRQSADAVPMVIFDLVQPDGQKALRFNPQHLRQPAGMVRGTLLEWAKRPYVGRAFGADIVARLLAGHQAGGESTKSRHNGHFGIVPLPSLNRAATADGDLRRVAFIGWGAHTASEAELFEEAVSGLHGAPLFDRGHPSGMLIRAPERVASHWREFWSVASRCWRSVTPVVLPGQLRRGRPPEALVARALKQAGYQPEEIKSIAAFTGPLVPKTYPAHKYRLGDYLDTTPRYHVEVLFHLPVSGPIVLGRGRYAGVGLCMPSEE